MTSWSECSVTENDCSSNDQFVTGTESRNVICLQSISDYQTSDPTNCSELDVPIIEQTCDVDCILYN